VPPSGRGPPAQQPQVFLFSVEMTVDDPRPFLLFFRRALVAPSGPGPRMPLNNNARRSRGPDRARGAARCASRGYRVPLSTKFCLDRSPGSLSPFEFPPKTLTVPCPSEDTSTVTCPPEPAHSAAPSAERSLTCFERRGVGLLQVVRAVGPCLSAFSLNRAAHDLEPPRSRRSSKVRMPVKRGKGPAFDDGTRSNATASAWKTLLSIPELLLSDPQPINKLDLGECPARRRRWVEALKESRKPSFGVG